jgi:hypothetical protein
LIEESSFEELLALCKEDLAKAEDEKAPTPARKKNVDKVVEDLRRKEKKTMGLD